MEDIFRDSPFYFYIRVMKWFGQWPFQSKMESNIRKYLIISLLLSIFVPSIIKFYEFRNDVYKMMDCIPMLGLHLASISKFINWSYHHEKIEQLLMHMQYDWSNLRNKFDADILEKFRRPSQILYVIYAIIGIYGTTAVYLVTPLVPIILNIVLPLNESRPHVYVYHTEYFVDQNKYYYPIQLHAYMTIPVSVTCLVAFDQMCAMFIQHACGMLEILKMHLQNLHATFLANDGTALSLREEAVAKEIIYCVRIHNRIFKFLEIVEHWDQVVLLIVGAGNTMTLTACGVGAILNKPDFLGFVRLTLFNFGGTMHLFYNCWQGHLILEQGESIFILAYQNEWYELPCHLQRMLLPIMAKSMKPREITACKLFPMSLATFGMAMRASLSYFTLFKSMK
ncbi:odorant receptor Or2-like isoform X1 [Fopius arisanus]|uniref:Odorant receptor n=1 Tax=Fopius arisanus TaxID=64838 RepID=A0A9R1UBI7_9HYME|nr:PREDICTED: odorant receptor Or2-like isoform X1 [Fopius arisanus]